MQYSIQSRITDLTTKTEVAADQHAGAAPAGGVGVEEIKRRFGYLLRRAHQKMRQNLEEEISAQFHITATQHAILTVLDACGSIDQSAIARILDLDRMTVGVTIKNLVRSGMVSQIQSPKDKRRNLITLTPKAARDMPEIQRLARRAHERHTSERLSAREQRLLVELLQKLTS